MKRRAFLGFLGGAAAAGPKAMADAAAMSELRMGKSWGPLTPTFAPAVPDVDRLSWQKKALKRLLGMSAQEKEFRRANFTISEIEPEVAVLRSMAFTSKIRRSRDIAFERSQAHEIGWLEARITGLVSEG